MFYAFKYCKREILDDRTIFTGPCVALGTKHTVVVLNSELEAYRQGKPIQDAMPRLNAENREFLQSGISPEGWRCTFFPSQVRELAQLNYEAGGSYIIECFTDEEILEEFKTLDDVKTYCKLKCEQATNCRWGEDDDPEVNRPEWQDI